MDAQRIEGAVQRIEAALARIAAAADAVVPPPASVSALLDRHEALRETAQATLADLDALIDRLDQ